MLLRDAAEIRHHMHELYKCKRADNPDQMALDYGVPMTLAQENAETAAATFRVAIERGYLDRVTSLITDFGYPVDSFAPDNARSEAAQVPVPVAHDRRILDGGEGRSSSDSAGAGVATTPLHAAIEYDKFEVLTLLLDSGANPNVQSPAHAGASPLALAAQKGFALAVAELLKRGAVVNQRSDDGSTAITLAIKKGWTDVIQQLVAAGASDVVAADGRTPAMHAILHGQPDVVEMLFNAGPDTINLDATDEEGRTSLWHAVDQADVRSVRTLWHAMCQGDSHSAGCDPDPLEGLPHGDRVWIATGPSSGYFVRQHPKETRGGPAIQLGGLDYSAFFHAATKGNVKITEVLLELAGGSATQMVAAKNADGKTALHLAAGSANAEMVEFLLAHGADVTVDDGTDRPTPLQEARSNRESAFDAPAFGASAHHFFAHLFVSVAFVAGMVLAMYHVALVAGGEDGDELGLLFVPLLLMLWWCAPTVLALALVLLVLVPCLMLDHCGVKCGYHPSRSVTLEVLETIIELRARWHRPYTPATRRTINALRRAADAAHETAEAKELLIH